MGWAVFFLRCDISYRQEIWLHLQKHYAKLPLLVKKGDVQNEVFKTTRNDV